MPELLNFQPEQSVVVHNTRGRAGGVGEGEGKSPLFNSEFPLDRYSQKGYQ